LRDAGSAAAIPEELTATISELKRVAGSHEALVSALPDRENRAAAAFVAGTAHYVCLLAERLVAAHQTSEVGHQAISSDVAATVLFLVAEATADASEMAKSIDVVAEDIVEQAVLIAIRNLANGQLHAILQMSVPQADQMRLGGLISRAVRALYFLIFNGIRSLAASMLGFPEGVELIEQDASLIFERVKKLSADPTSVESDIEGGYALYPGPYHLASLLLSATRDLQAAAVINIPAPKGLDGGRWHNAMLGIADRRPYLWRNHRQAISAGYLNWGVSAAVSFPTGAGKSTLAELKIATALLRGLKVVFLAPTLALVDQTAKALAVTFPAAELQRERAEQSPFDVASEVLPSISVMTPERCLTLLSFDREAFVDVGLLIFDECHLLHPRGIDRSRRALDAMLCVLNFTAVAPTADLLLLSAMMMNASELAEWIGELTGRPCLALALTWKPTRQVRGCVVYGVAEVRRLNEKLRQTRQQVTNVKPPSDVARELKAQPFGFFCLRQTWQSTARNDYSLLPLLEHEVRLSTGTAKDKSWYLTPNANQVAASVAGGAAKQRLKTLIFTQTIPLVGGAIKTVSAQLGSANCALTAEEKHLYATIVDELGDASRLYIDVENDLLISAAVSHHGLLLPAERNLHESLFRRKDGANVIIATSTLAQGMNLPSEVVIIAGDSRFDPNANKVEKLEAHELLNAAGRAGRAGDGSYGFVLVVPSKVVHFDNVSATIHNHWTDLQAIFSQSDQCLLIDDPITAVLNQIHLATTDASAIAKYFVRRLPAGDAANAEKDDEAVRSLLSRSFGAFRARARGDEVWLKARIQAAIDLRRSEQEAPDASSWADKLAAAAGIPTDVIRELSIPLSGTIRSEATVVEWRDWLMDWLSTKPELIPQLIRRENLEGLLGAPYKKLETDGERGKHALPILRLLLAGWMSGATLSDLELAFGTPMHRLGNCEIAREFVVRLVPELAYVFALPAQIFKAARAALGLEAQEPPLDLGLLSLCVREGVDDVEKLALRQAHRGRVNRRAIHRQDKEIRGFMHERQPLEPFSSVITRVQAAISASALKG
jgi:hypothetical protein